MRRAIIDHPVQVFDCKNIFMNQLQASPNVCLGKLFQSRPDLMKLPQAYVTAG